MSSMAQVQSLTTQHDLSGRATMCRHEYVATRSNAGDLSEIRNIAELFCFLSPEPGHCVFELNQFHS